MNYFVHPQGICESSAIGVRTKIWAFAHVLPGAVIGEDCNVCDHVFIENDVVIGNRVTVKCGVQLWDGLRVEDDVFIGPNATFTNDPFPRSKQRPEQFEITYLRRGCSIGANATILLASRLVKMPWSVLARWSPSLFLPMPLCRVILRGSLVIGLRSMPLE
jgi:UDP-3-O-[3-hydroxymyristoyl] glucosamine N-acyltransferase